MSVRDDGGKRRDGASRLGQAGPRPERVADELGANGGEVEGDGSGDGPAPERPYASTVREWLAGAPLDPLTHKFLGLLLPAAIALGHMWRVRAYTVDDAFISFRYARNLARGLGLVYNPGERVEGYTNFLWTLLLSGGIKLGLDPEPLAKELGAIAAIGAMALTYALAARLRPLGAVPCVATWLLASTGAFAGYAVFGMEAPLFTCLVLGGTLLFHREEDRGARFPWSGLVFALAGLTRPEAPLYLGVLMLALGGLRLLFVPRRMFEPRNVLRAALFLGPLGAHLCWRRWYYGAWLPNTFVAKTGDLDQQIRGGWQYLSDYLTHAGPVLYLALGGLAAGLVWRQRELLAYAAIALLGGIYIVLVGGDWMPLFRFVVPLEQFLFLLVCHGVRSLVEQRRRVANVALFLFALLAVYQRASIMREDRIRIVRREKAFWDRAAGGTARLLLDKGEPGTIAMGDIGYIGYATDFPVLDLLGLLDPLIAQQPGGYTRKIGAGYRNRFFERAPRYFLLVSAENDCAHPSVPGSIALFNDRRFAQRYAESGRVRLDGGFSWCIYERRDVRRAGAPEQEALH
ncbi:MAG: hypothetical protein HY744_20470 [Deltaproteobacteria bacterium]|nr:hypothetical protein [Deltaproteobacteria bacterium]